MRQEWTRIDRILDKRKQSGQMEYLVKWEGLPYDQLTWESENLIKKFPDKLSQYETIHVQPRSTKEKSSRKKHNGNSNTSFQEFKTQPPWVRSPLFEWQLDGLNWLRYSMRQKNNVILADEMGLGKTIQTIIFLLSVYNEHSKLLLYLCLTA